VRYFLYQLPPESLYSLASALAQAKSLSLKKLFLEVIAWQLPKIQASQPDIQKLAPMFNEWAIEELLGMLSLMRLPLPSMLAAQFARHRSPKVRSLAAKHVLDSDPENFAPVAHLIVDPDPSVRESVTPRLTKRRDQTVEGVLQSFLQARYQTKSGGKGILDYYRAFGLSAGVRSVGFLSGVLFKKDIGSFFGSNKDWHMAGAALSLRLMPDATGAGEIFAKAKKSAFRSTRWACEEAETMLEAERLSGEARG
jgi:hypothetical protein